MTYGRDEHEQDEMDRGRDRDDEEEAYESLVDAAERTDFVALDDDEIGWPAGAAHPRETF